MDSAYRVPDAFQTERYSLRRIAPADASSIFESYATDAVVTRHLTWLPHTKIDDTTEFVNAAIEEWETGRGFPLVVFARSDTGDLIGMFHPRAASYRVSYGYVLRASAWGKGCASEVMTWLVDHALSHPAIFRVEAFCDVDNPASARVMEKAGMTCEGILRRYFRHPNISDDPRDCVIYSKVR